MLDRHMVYVLMLLTVLFLLCEKEPFQSQVFVFGTSCCFSPQDSTHRLLFELWLNYKELYKANRMICNLFRAKLILLRYESQVENMLALPYKMESCITEPSSCILPLICSCAK